MNNVPKKVFNKSKMRSINVQVPENKTTEKKNVGKFLQISYENKQTNDVINEVELNEFIEEKKKKNS